MEQVVAEAGRSHPLVRQELTLLVGMVVLEGVEDTVEVRLVFGAEAMVVLAAAVLLEPTKAATAAAPSF